jgi:hypothetical protein
MYLIVDCSFNRQWYPHLINKYCNNPPAYAYTKEIHPYRKHSC